MNPKISIITVCYNSQIHLEEAILSVLNQSYTNKEYIIIDGGSSDGTHAIIERYKDRIDYFVSEPDQGISDAFNKGIQAATGDIIGICNADDQLAFDCLKIVAENYEPGIEIYRMNEIVRDYETGEDFLTIPTIKYEKKCLFHHNTGHMGCFITKSAYEKYGAYDVNLRIQMDTDLLYRFSVLGAKTKYINANCGYFRRGGVSSKEVRRRNYERNFIMKRYGASSWQICLSMIYHLTRQVLKKILIYFNIDPIRMRIMFKK